MLSFKLGNANKNETQVNPEYLIGESKYAWKCNYLLEVFETGHIDVLNGLFTEDVLFDFPNTIDGERENLKGRGALISYWKEWLTLQNVSIMISEINSVPIRVLNTPNYIGLTGNWVFSWFNVSLNNHQRQVGTRANATFHFSEDDFIDRIFTYYDRKSFSINR